MNDDVGSLMIMMGSVGCVFAGWLAAKTRPINSI